MYTSPFLLRTSLQFFLTGIIWLSLMSSSFAQVDNSLIGEWHGVVEQPGFGTFDTEMRIDSLVVNVNSGDTEYPSLSCGGDNVFLEEISSVHFFSETITFGNCIDGIIQIYKLSADTIQYDWYYANGDLGAFGQLARYTSTSVAQLDREMISLFPNPASGAFILRSPQAVIESIALYDLTGRLLSAEITYGRQETQVRSQYRGLVMVQVQTDQGSWVQKVWLQ